jgi:hypothetical protein
MPKWDDQARVVTLVLSLTTGLMLAQHHVVFNDHFQTVRTQQAGPLFYKSDWQDLAGFNLELEEPKKKDKRGGRAARMVKQ